MVSLEELSYTEFVLIGICAAIGPGFTDRQKVEGTWASPGEMTHCPSPCPHSSLFSSPYVLLLVLELPLLLSMLSAVVWVNGPQRSSRSRQSWPEGENQ